MAESSRSDLPRRMGRTRRAEEALTLDQAAPQAARRAEPRRPRGQRLDLDPDLSAWLKDLSYEERVPMMWFVVELLTVAREDDGLRAKVIKRLRQRQGR
ncbi:MAG: hypothetical protein J2P57_21450 [Acidimicrobiaceae bacterium]|nr:hypothetical protein [Acidimicrobiaceae bacterium]